MLWVEIPFGEENRTHQQDEATDCTAKFAWQLYKNCLLAFIFEKERSSLAWSQTLVLHRAVSL